MQENINTKIDLKEFYKTFLASEKEINESDEIKILSYKKDMTIVKYGDMIKHYDKNSQEVINASKEMSEAIYKLNNHHLVQIYNKNLANLNSFLKEIRDELFGGLLW